MSLVCFNRTVACTPFPEIGPQIERKGGTVRIVSRAKFAVLTVVIGNDEASLHPGDKVYVEQSDYMNGYVKNVMESNLRDGEGKPLEIIVVPFDRIVLVDRQPQ